MDPRLPVDVQEFGRSASEMLRRRAGVELARRSHASPADAREEAGRLLASIEADEIDPWGRAEESLAAAELCRAAGGVALPYPVAQRLCREPHGMFAVVPALATDADRVDAVEPDVAAAGADQLAVAPAPARPIVADHADLLDAVVALDGRRAPIVGRTPLGGKLSRYAAEVETGQADGTVPATAVALWLDLQAAYVIGALETAVALTVEHTSQRRQFGRALSSFQALRFQVVEASLACRGTLHLLRFTLWRWHEAPEDALVDALGLRLQMQEAAKRVLAIAHQLHGAMGFASEHDLPFLTRGIQTAMRLPLDYEATTAALLEGVDASGFDTLYGRFTPGASAAASALPRGRSAASA